MQVCDMKAGAGNEYCPHFFPVPIKWWIIKRNIYCFDFSFIPKPNTMFVMCEPVWQLCLIKHGFSHHHHHWRRSTKSERHVKKTLQRCFVNTQSAGACGITIWFLYATANIWMPFVFVDIFCRSRAHVFSIVWCRL